MNYNIKTTRIFFNNNEGGIAYSIPTGELPVEVVAVRDLPSNTPYWIIDFETFENMKNAYPDKDFFDAYELDQEVLGPPHGVSLGYDEWAKLQEPGTLGL